MYQEELAKLKCIKQEYNEMLPNPVEESEVHALSIKFKDEFGTVLPIDYYEFLKQCDGVEFNGCIIYGSKDLLECQLDYEYITEKYIVFAEYDIGWFCMNKIDRGFYELDKPSGSKMRSFESMENMIKYVLQLSVEL